MWICRQCAAHVEETDWQCPACAHSAPPRLQPHLAKHISPTAYAPAPQPKSLLLRLPGLPLLERQWQKHAVQLGALLGFSGCLVHLALTIDFREKDTALLSTIVLHVFMGMLCSFWGAMISGFLAMFAGDIADYFDRRAHPRKDLDSLPPRSILAKKTDSLGQKATLGESELADKITQGADQVCSPRNADAAIQPAKKHITPHE